MQEKRKLPLPLVILIIGLVIGVLLAAFGFYKQQNAKKINEKRYNEAYKLSQEKVDAANKRYSEIENQLSSLNSQYESKKQECDSLNMNDSNWFANKNKCEREASSIDSKITELEMEQFKLKNGDYSVTYANVKPMSYQIFYIIGASVFGLSLLGSFIIYLVKGKKTYN